MAANDDLPRGWTYTYYGSGPASITVPATVGVAHVLDGFSCTSDSSAPADLAVEVQSSDTYNDLIIGLLTAAPGEADGSGLGLACMPGEQLIVKTNASGGSQLLVIQGHDN